MKKLLCLLFVCFSLSASAQAQNIDTVLVRNLSLQTQDWLVMLAVTPSEDSSANVAVRRIRAALSVGTPTFTQVVIVDNIPGTFALAMYKAVKSAPAGVIASRYTAITGAINGKANMIYHTNIVDLFFTASFLRARTRGKNIAMDN